MPISGRKGELHDILDGSAQFTPVMRFILFDPETRSFEAQRWCYLGSIDDWIDLSASGTLEQMARRLIPTLGTDRFFELF